MSLLLKRYTVAVVRRRIYLRLNTIRHHERSILYHNLRVARVAYRWAKFLRRWFDFRVRVKALIRGALLHDFFFYDWRRERPVSGKLHAFEHPRESANNAHYYYRITHRERNIILSHMWPLGIWPRYRESWLVTMADKWVSLKEFLRKWSKKEYSRVRNKDRNTCFS